VGYNVEGGLVVVKPDGTKEFNVRDHIGNVRATYSFKQGYMQYRNYDYKPFGDTLWTSGANENGWKGFNGESKDLESSFMNMGARIYDPSISRFLSVDPLYEMFPNQSSYSYSFNNPLSYRDPSGLAPEKEKKKKALFRGLFCLFRLPEAADW
jgi:RHS repeat-associated protein